MQTCLRAPVSGGGLLAVTNTLTYWHHEVPEIAAASSIMILINCFVLLLICNGMS